MTWQVLYQADATLPFPFQVLLQDNNGPLICEKVIRLVPFRRLVVYAKWQGQEVIAKLFFNPKKAKDTFFRDARGVNALMQVNIPTPKLLYQGTVLNQPNFYVMILEKIPNVKTVADYWHAKQNIQSIFPLMKAVTIEIATHHVLGILQRDIHLKNFLVNDEGIYSIDGSKITIFKNPIPKKISLKYFALFLVQLGAGTQALRMQLFNIYAKARGWLITSSDLQSLQKQMKSQSQDLLRRYIKKIFRDCSLFKKINTSTSMVMYNREYKSTEFMQLLKNPDLFFSADNTILLKKGRSSTVAKIQIDQRSFVLKRYNIKNLIHRLKNVFRKTRANLSWRLAQQLYSQSITTPKPIALIDRPLRSLNGKSYFLTEFINGPTLGDFFSTYNQEDSLFSHIADQLISLLINLKEMRITHGDLKMTNILVYGYHPFLIDFDGARKHLLNFSLERAFKADVKRFMKNWQDNPPVYHLFEKLIHEKMGSDILK